MDNQITKEGIKKVLEKVAQYRGVIIQDSINIEALIDSIIINYFIKENKHSEFLTKVVEDENFSFGLKINILEKLNLETYKEFIQDVRRINAIRNIFAHCLPGSFTTGALFYYNKNKKTHELKELEELHKEFLEKLKKVDEQLTKLFNKLVEEKKSEKKNETQN